MKKKPDKVAFLDRDGVINRDPYGWTAHDYVTRWADFHFLPGVFEALRMLKGNGYRAVIISNQAGVGRGYFSKERLSGLDRKMRAKIRKNGGSIGASYYCAHTKDDGCRCRKPGTGLFEKAWKRRAFDARASYFVGDSEKDMIAGARAGLKTILVLSGRTAKGDADGWRTKPDHICEDLREAAGIICAQRAIKQRRGQDR